MTDLQLNKLSEHERRVIELAILGHERYQIALSLGISIKSVENARSRAYVKLGVHSIAELAWRWHLKENAMTNEKLLEVVDVHTRKMQNAGLLPVRNDDPASRAFWCLNQIQQMVRDGKIDKAHRWLGFVQGVMFAIGMHTVDELADISRSE